MKILVICQYYKPEPFNISDICEELVRRGHDVTVVTGIPNYPMGQVYDGYRHGEKRDEILNGVNVHRCFTVGRRSGVFWRVMNYYSYAVSSKHYISKIKEEYDVVFVYQLSPVIMTNAGIKYKKKYNKKMVLYCLDLWPESLIAGGIKRGSFIYRHYLKVSEKIYREADRIYVSSRPFTKYFSDMFGLDSEYLPQYAVNTFAPDICRKEPDEYTDLMFAGNIGMAQNVEIIVSAAKKLENMKNIRFHIVGDGSELQKIKSSADGLSNVIFYGRIPTEQMAQYYSKADAMLVTMKDDDFLSLTLPSKVQSYMAAGKPIIGAISGETQKIIRETNTGYCCDAGDTDGFVECIKKFVQNKDRTVFSRNAYSFYESKLSREQYMDKIERHLIDASGKRSE